MKLLFDENLSPKLIKFLVSEFPLSEHVVTLGMQGTNDASIWDFAKRNSFTIVSKDNDFRQFSFLYGPPPKVIWVSIGNAGTWYIAELLRARLERIRSFIHDSNDSMLILGQGVKGKDGGRVPGKR